MYARQILHNQTNCVPIVLLICMLAELFLFLLQDSILLFENDFKQTREGHKNVLNQTAKCGGEYIYWTVILTVTVMY